MCVLLKNDAREGEKEKVKVYSLSNVKCKSVRVQMPVQRELICIDCQINWSVWQSENSSSSGQWQLN